MEGDHIQTKRKCQMAHLPFGACTKINPFTQRDQRQCTWLWLCRRQYEKQIKKKWNEDRKIFKCYYDGMTFNLPWRRRRRLSFPNPLGNDHGLRFHSTNMMSSHLIFKNTSSSSAIRGWDNLLIDHYHSGFVRAPSQLLLFLWSFDTSGLKWPRRIFRSCRSYRRSRNCSLPFDLFSMKRT